MAKKSWGCSFHLNWKVCTVYILRTIFPASQGSEVDSCLFLSYVNGIPYTHSNCSMSNSAQMSLWQDNINYLPQQEYPREIFPMAFDSTSNGISDCIRYLFTLKILSKKAFTFWTAIRRGTHKSKKAQHVDLLTSTFSEYKPNLGLWVSHFGGPASNTNDASLVDFVILI